MTDKVTKIAGNQAAAKDHAIWIEQRDSVNLKGSTAPQKTNLFLQSQAASPQLSVKPVVTAGSQQNKS